MRKVKGKLYILDGFDSRNNEAEQILQSLGIEYEVVDVEKANLLAWIGETLGIQKLPAFIEEIEIKRVRLEGILEIREYQESQFEESPSDT